MADTKTQGNLVILMADGHLEDHETVKKAARECGINHVFTSVYNGAQLRDYLFRKGAYYSKEEVLPDIIIMDIHLDLLHGFAALDMIAGENKLKNIPVYILTKTKKEEDVLRAKNYGVRDFFQKPMAYSDWTRIVMDICTRELKTQKAL